VLPPDAPVAGGDVLPWVRNEPHVGRTNYLYLQTLPVGALCQMMSMVNGVFTVEYSLLVQDPQLAACMDILVDELTHDPSDARIAHAQMLTLMLRLQRRLKARMPLLTDGLYSRFPEGDRLNGEARVRDNPVVEKVLQFIQLYLHEPLTPERIAAHVRMTPNQLNRVLRRNTGLTIMGSLQRLRMEAAQLLLHTSSLSVLEISRLVGFSQQPHFSRTFHSYTGTSPLKFRQQHEVETHSR
jgi:AraC-like DNA-binding protein